MNKSPQTPGRERRGSRSPRANRSRGGGSGGRRCLTGSSTATYCASCASGSTAAQGVIVVVVFVLQCSFSSVPARADGRYRSTCAAPQHDRHSSSVHLPSVVGATSCRPHPQWATVLRHGLVGSADSSRGAPPSNVVHVAQ